MLINIKRIFALLQAMLFVVSSFSVYDSNFKEWVDRAAVDVTGTTDFTFDTITAEELKVKESEKEKCREWYENNILTTSNPAYDFTVNGKKLSDNLGDWEFNVGEESEAGKIYRNGKTAYITLSHKKSDLKATVEATIYEEYATCEWTVYIKNEGTANSPVIKDFYGANTTVDTGFSELYVSQGSSSDADDFELHKTSVNVTPMAFNANGGRTSSFLPYFNISGNKGGVVMCVGWTGQWYSSVSQAVNGVKLKAKQEYFNAYLTGGEQVRSPLVSLTFYDGSNALKGFNTLRSWESNCVYTESAFPLTTTGLAGEFDRRSEKEYIEQINSYDELTCEKTDFLWRDAGWYKINENWYDSVGNWVADPVRFPNGLKPVSDAAKEKGMGLLLWYEPERCCKDTIVYNECIKHEGWLIKRTDEVNLVNIAIDGACDYLGNLVSQSLKEYGIGLYRQDFNFTPLELWQEADKLLFNGRTGIEENHYVTNLYRYLDTLIEVNPGLIIDNCASGGRRLDLEMSRRSIPLWRTDYNCADENGKVHDDCPEATQVGTYGISCWLPLTGTGLNSGGEYVERSLITPCAQRTGYEDIRSLMTENYFPIEYGGLNTKKFLAMQFGNEAEGAALIYKRADVRENTYTVIFNGLSPNSVYKYYDYDNKSVVNFVTGSELMKNGVTLKISETPKAVIVKYEKVK